MARVEGFEPPTPGLEGLCSIQLSYTRQIQNVPQQNRLRSTKSLG